MLTFEDVDEILTCDNEDCVCYWKKNVSSRGRAGDVAGCKHSAGYISIKVNGRAYLAHRIVWLLKNGEWPAGQIDHIDGDRSNSRIENLRDTDSRGNNRNGALRSTNTSGTCGVSWHSRAKKWQAYISDNNGKWKHLGFFDDINDAIFGRKSAEIELGYHQNHGRMMKEKK